MSQLSQAGRIPGVSVETPSLVTTSVLACSIVFPILATASIIVRVYCQQVMSARPKADDWVILLALLMSWAQSISVYVAAKKAGVNTTTLPQEKAARVYLMCIWIEGLALAVCLTAIKISILLFYNRIFTIRPFRLSVYFAIIILTGWGVSTFVCQLLAGDPIDSIWDPQVSKLRFNYRAWAISTAGISLIFDLLVLCFPLFVIRTLHLPTRRKVTIAGIFWLGGFCCIAAALRLYFLQARPGDKYYESKTQAFLWAYIEPNISIVAACLPTYGPLFTGDGPAFITNIRSRIASLLVSKSSGSSGSRFWRVKIFSSHSSDSKNDRFISKGRKPNNSSSSDDDGQELMLQKRKEEEMILP